MFLLAEFSEFTTDMVPPPLLLRSLVVVARRILPVILAKKTDQSRSVEKFVLDTEERRRRCTSLSNYLFVVVHGLMQRRSCELTFTA